jgi:hypothetical protein
VGQPVWQSYAPRPSRWDPLIHHWRRIGVAVLVLAVVGGVGAWFTIPKTADRYLAELKAQNLSRSYTTNESAVAEGKAFCAGLTSGKPDEGYRYQLVAVRHFCPQFRASFKVLPTPVELQNLLMKTLTEQNLGETYPSPESAVSQSKAFCAGLDLGKAVEGYPSQLIGVQIYCPTFVAGFTVIPTPEEQQEKLTTELRDKGLGGKFASDAAAVAHAKSVCTALDDGGEQQGPKADAISVSVYCPKYEDGFTTLRPIKVKGTLEVVDTSIYSQGLIAGGGRCTGHDGYSDIYGGQDVTITNADGKQLTRTELGSGVGDEYSCTFAFTFTVMEGEDDYLVQVSHRGELHYTQAQLKTPGRVSVNLGS